MSNIPVPQAKYELLEDETKPKFVSSRKLCCTSAILLILVALIGFILLIINLQFFINGVQVPDYYDSELDLPDEWVTRAIKYSKSEKISESTSECSIKTLKNDKIKSVQDYKLVCYYAIPKPTIGSIGRKNLLSDKIDPNLCTHINVGFFSIRNNTILLTPIGNETLRNVTSLKKENKNLKVLMSIGGAGQDTGFPAMVLNHQTRKRFIRSAVNIIKEFKLDGIDLDWEFPNEHKNGDKKQRTHFTQLLYEIRAEINRHAEKHRFLLSVAVGAPKTIVDNSYDVACMNDKIDYINLMSYDYHFYTKYTPFTGLNAPLYPKTKETGFFSTMNINSSAYYWHTLGIDKSKIIIGLPTYGHSFRLVNPANNGLTAPASGYGRLGNVGFVDYADICWFISVYQIKPIFDIETKSPYAYKDNEWISYDDMQSLSYKTEFIKENDFGGAMILSLNTDDHKGSCYEQKNSDEDETFPLTRKVKSILYDDQL